MPDKEAGVEIPEAEEPTAGEKEEAEPEESGKPAEEPKAQKELSVSDMIREVHELLTGRVAAEYSGLNEFLRSTRKMLWTNFLLGLSRGVGFFLGMTILGAIILGIGTLATKRAFNALNMSDPTERISEWVIQGLNEWDEVEKRVRTRRAAQEEAEGETPDEESSATEEEPGGEKTAPEEDSTQDEEKND